MDLGYLHLVDFWGSKRFGQQKKASVQKRFESQIKSGSMQINLGLSQDVIPEFEDNYFDWVYIDTAHTYQTTIDEPRLLEPKMKEKGVISGHDFVTGYWEGFNRYGVVEAVNQFCLENNWEFIYLTRETDRHLSFAIRSI